MDRHDDDRRVTLSFEATREDILNLRRVLTWAQKNEQRCEQRLERRREESALAARQGLQEDIDAKVRLLRATKGHDYYDGIRRTVKSLLGRWQSDQPELFEDVEESTNGEAVGRAGSEGEDGGEESAVSGASKVPSERPEPARDVPVGPAELAGDRA